MHTIRLKQGNEIMPFVKIGPRHQITIPKEVFDTLDLEPGGVLEIVAREGKAILIPKQVSTRPPAPKLSETEQQLLASAKQKIEAINEDILNAVGLTREEADVAAKAGLIDPDQKYWWLEDWQKGEREAECDIQEGRVSGPFTTAEELIAHLHRQKA
jgi:AbrB family looped-hinge helix DNA binding protein